jgi:hypothetical protein
VKFIFAMQRLHLIGKLDSLSATPYQLEVPSFFHQEKVVKTTKEIADGVKLDIAWGGDKVKSWSLGKSYEPHRNVTFTCYNREEEKNWVNYKLSVHPMPRNLGPIIPVIDNGDDENFEEHVTKLIEKVASLHGDMKQAKSVPDGIQKLKKMILFQNTRLSLSLMIIVV